MRWCSSLGFLVVLLLSNPLSGYFRHHALAQDYPLRASTRRAARAPWPRTGAFKKLAFSSSLTISPPPSALLSFSSQYSIYWRRMLHLTTSYVPPTPGNVKSRKVTKTGLDYWSSSRAGSPNLPASALLPGNLADSSKGTRFAWVMGWPLLSRSGRRRGSNYKPCAQCRAPARLRNR